jgi:ABC-type transport system involved in multi-copper enzyme maturation permease subunit
MIGLVDVLVGPLASPECRRLAGRGWSILIRGLLGTGLGMVVLATLWWWWLNQSYYPDAFLPYQTLRVGLVALLGLEVTFALAITPALLAGSLAGDRDRQAMGLLLTTRMNSFEIVRGRLAGRYSQLGMALIAGLPGLLMLGWLAGLGVATMLVMIAYPFALVFGAGGLTAAASSVSRKGRDALLGSYLIGFLVLLAPALIALYSPVTVPGLAVLNPYLALGPLVSQEAIGPAVGAMMAWGAVGILGTATASLRLRPVCLRWLGGEPSKKRWSRRWRVLPRMGDRPMLWKELYTERGGAIAGFAWWLGLLAALYLTIASTVFAILIFLYFRRGDLPRADEYTALMGGAIADLAPFFSILMQLAVGLRAAVSISGERERLTWDGLLTSPLEGREIVWGKLWGSLYALRWLLLAILYSWAVALAVGAMEPFDFATTIVGAITGSAFLAAVGIRASLSVQTGTSSMGVTMGAWLATLIVFFIAAWLVVLFVALMFLLAWLALTGGSGAGLTAAPGPAAPGPWFPMSAEAGYALASNLLYVIATFLLASETALRFDRLAGRMSSGAWALAVDDALNGAPLEPVLLVEDWPSAKPIGVGVDDHPEAD